jgi:hypothetical protein
MHFEIVHRNERGDYEPVPILSPLACAISPALDARCSEISIVLAERHSQTAPSRPIQLTYKLRGGERKSADVPKDFPQYILWSRLRIVAEISIVSRELCHGRLFVRTPQGILPIDVRAETTQDEERFSLLPDWSHIANETCA